MAQSDPVGEVRTAFAQVMEDADEEAKAALLRSKDKAAESARRTEAVALRLAGLSYGAIAERLGISQNAAYTLIERALDRAEMSTVSAMRDLENARLDRAQSAIWGQVINGDHKAISLFLSISSARSKINGLYAPTQVQISMTIRQEMEEALRGLETLVLEEVRPDETYVDVVDEETL